MYRREFYIDFSKQFVVFKNLDLIFLYGNVLVSCFMYSVWIMYNYYILIGVFFDFVDEYLVY